MASGTRLFVSNLPDNAEEQELQSAFSKYGAVTNIDLKSKNASAQDQKKFAFVTITGTHYNIESCIKHFSNEDFNGNRLYVTRARESFLERLQREREETKRKEAEKHEPQENLPTHNPIIKLSEKLNPRKRKLDNRHEDLSVNDKFNNTKIQKDFVKNEILNSDSDVKRHLSDKDKKKVDSDKRRMDSMKQKRQEFKQKQMIIKTGLTAVDKVPNKKVIFSDNEEGNTTPTKNGQKQNINKNSLFDNDEDSEDDYNFEVKEQFEGVKGQKVLDLQSRYKSDKRFTLDERFIEDEEPHENHEKDKANNVDEEVELGQDDEKMKQLNILQNVLGVTIKTRTTEQDSNKKPKLGMLRFDPLQPQHAKFMVPVETKVESTKKTKNKKDKWKTETEKEKQDEGTQEEENKVIVSTEQFYKVSDTLKEAIAQPTEFSLRSLFSKNQDVAEAYEQETEFIPVDAPKKPKVVNPLDPGQKNPFVYDSSDSEPEEEEKKEKPEVVSVPLETKAVWKENLFFTKDDSRLIDGLKFFSTVPDKENHKDRRELKSLMKKRIYNKERKSQMFQKKIGGRRKTMKKSFRKKS